MKPTWNHAVVVGWLIWFGAFVALDLAAWLSRDPRLPTFSRVIVKLFPWWIALPASAALFFHWLSMYLKKP